MMNKNQKCEEVINLFENKLKELNPNKEDKKLIFKLVYTYYRKKKGVSNSASDVMAASFLWLYSKMNFLWESDKDWMQMNIASLFGIRSKTISNKSAEISKALKIQLWDDRFCKKKVLEHDPFKKFAMTAEGMIIPKDMAQENLIPFMPLKKSKEDYFYDAWDHIDEGNTDKAIRTFKKALEIDDEYVDAYHGLGCVYFFEDIEKSKEYYQKAYELTKKYFNDKWPEILEWGFLENRQYLRSIHSWGLVLWRENKFDEAKELFILLLRLNKGDNQGARYLVAAILKGLSWDEFGKIEERCMETGDYTDQEKLFEEQNKTHKFYSYPGYY